jgi:regulatory protein
MTAWPQKKDPKKDWGKKRIKKFPLTQDRLAHLALRYVSRYAATRGMLKKVLSRHILKARHENPDFDERQAHEWMEALLDKHEAQGWINDKTFTGSLVRAGKNSGMSRARISQKLQSKGVDRELIRDTLLQLEEEGISEEEAARIFAQKKRLGPWRKKQGPLENQEKQKEIAKLCRAGFSVETARKALKKED